MAQLEKRGWPWLAHQLESVGKVGGKADLGRHKTWAGPGESLHQYGLAGDGVPLEHGTAPLWDAKAREWEIYGACAREVGLTWAGDWSSGKRSSRTSRTRPSVTRSTVRPSRRLPVEIPSSPCTDKEES